MEWMIMPLRRYADFEGRSRRLEYWLFTLFLFIVICGLTILMVALSGGTDQSEGSSSIAAVWGIFLVLLLVGVFVPSLAVQVRRMHDQNMSGWWILLALVPFGSLIILIFMLIPGTKGPNNYGPDPKDPEGADHLAEVFR